MTPSGLRVFLAAPYSQWVNPSTGRVETHLRQRLEVLRQGFLDHGAQVFNAHHNEDWGAGWLPADQCTPADFQAMRVADVVCAVIGSPLSGGVAVELGWASALGKPILVLAEEDIEYTPLIRGIHTVTRASFLTAPASEWPETFRGQVIKMTLSLTEERNVTKPVPSPTMKADLGYVAADTA